MKLSKKNQTVRKFIPSFSVWKTLNYFQSTLAVCYKRLYLNCNSTFKNY